MHKSPAIILVLITISLLAIRCQKELKNDNQLPPIPSLPDINATVSGRVINQSNEPVKGAIVTIGSTTTVTDVNGLFILTDASMKEDAGVVSVEKQGYFEGIRTFRSRSGQHHYVEMQLLPKDVSGEINANTGGAISNANGSTVTLPSNGFVLKSTGAAYSGNVKASVQFIDPSAPGFFRQMPGDLRGTDATGKEKTLSSFGILGIELHGSANEQLQLAMGKKASLKFSIPAALQSTAPSTIELWYFDETSGIWKQEGTATKAGNTYQAEVSHFSFWGVNLPSNTVQFTATFKDQNGNPLKYHLVRLVSAQYQYAQSYGFTDSTGFIKGAFVENRQMLLEVLMNASCTTAVHSQSVGPLPAGSLNLGTIQVNVPSMFSYTLTGNAINCSGQAVQDGYIEVSTGIQILRSQLVNGSFSVSFNHCSANQPVKYIIVDNGAGQQTSQTTLTLNSGNNNIGAVMACGISTQQFIKIIVDGTTYMLVSPTDSLRSYCYPANGALADITHIGASGFNPSKTTTMDFVASNIFNTVGVGQYNVQHPTPLVKLAGRTDTLERKNIVGKKILVNITEFGVPGEFMSGTISDTLWSHGLTVPHPYQFSFRVRRKD